MSNDKMRVTIKTAPAVLNLADKAMWVTGWNDCLDALAAQAQEAPSEPASASDEYPRFVIYTRPGKIPERKGPYPTTKFVEDALRELHQIYPDATSMVIRMPATCYPDSGVEWIDMHGDKRKGRLIAAAPASAQAAVPEGWPTNEMIEAGRKAAKSHGPLLGNGQSLWHIFRDMLAAAPSTQQGGGE